MWQVDWKATLYLEMRGRGYTDQRIYTATVPCKKGEDPILHMVRTSETFGATHQSVTTWRPDDFDAEALTAVFRQSLRRSERLTEELEIYGWERRLDLEATAQAHAEKGEA